MINVTRAQLTAVIPTRNRPADLAKAIESILIQTRVPDELIIVDQSVGDESKEMVTALLGAVKNISLIYIHDSRISGLVEAKSVAAAQAVGELVCYLEDDVILESDYIEQIEAGFVAHPEMVGCCGIITNPPNRSAGYKIMHDLFHVGIFRDIRPTSWGHFNGRERPLIGSEMLSGGLSAWRREVFAAVPFDLASGFHMFEDIDFSTRVARHFGPRLYINPNARLEHHWSPINREALGPGQRRKLAECIIYYKKRSDFPGATLALSWLLVGLFFESILKTFSSHSFEPLWGYLSGIRDGFSK